MKFENPYFQEVEKIEILQYWLLVQSYIYYELNNSIVSDANYNANFTQLKYLAKKLPQEFSNSRYSDYFKEISSSTMFNIFSEVEKNDKELMQRITRDATRALRLKK